MFRPIANLAIRTKILISSVLTLTLICTFIFLYYPSQQKQQLFQAMEISHHSLASTVAFGVGLGMATGDFGAVQQSLEWARRDSNLVYLVLLDEHEEVSAAFNPTKLIVDFPKMIGRDGMLDVGDRSLLVLSVPVEYRGRDYGTLLFGASLESLNRAVSDNATTTLFVSFVILLFGIASSMFFGHIITRPLKELRDAAEEISRGNHDVVVPVTTSDEVGTLGAVLKDMVENILRTLRESEEKFRSMSSSAQDAIFMVDSLGHISFWNAAAEKMLGYSAGEVEGTDVHAMIAAHDSLSDSERGFADFLRIDERPHLHGIVEVTALRRDGTEFPAELSMSEMKLGGTWHAMGIMRDLTKVKRAEAELKHLAMAIDQVSEAVLMTDSQGTITYSNPAFERISGYSFEEVVGRNCRLLSSGHHNQAFYQNMWVTITDGRIWSGKITNRKKDGSLCTEETTISPVHSLAGEIISYVAVKRDITQELLQEAAQLELHEKLDRAEKMESLGILAGGVAHDLNNMLGPVVGYAELILRDVSPDDKLGQRVSRISKSARDAADVIADLLTLARRGRYEMSPIDLNEVVSAYLDSPGHRGLIQNRPEVTFELNLDKSIPRMIGSSPHLSKVIMNLVVNACDAMCDGGQVTVSTSFQSCDTVDGGHEQVAPGEYLVLRVRDTGMGIDARDLDKIFEPYYSKKKMGTSGSGLGLSVVHGVVTDHHGYYDVFSEVGVGTEFVLYFPATNAPEQKGSDVQIDIEGNQTVLVVDDVEVQRQVATDILSSLGYQVCSSGTGQEAVQCLRDREFDIVVIDMMLEPDFDGLDTYRAMTEIRPDQKAIIVSGFSETERVREMQSLGAGKYLRKPFTIEKLGLAIRSELDKPAPVGNSIPSGVT